MNKLDFLREAINELTASMDAVERAEEASSERLAASWQRTGERRERQAQTLALLSLAQDVRRIADALDRNAADEYLAESMRIFGS